MPYRFKPLPAFDARMAVHIALIAVLAWLGLVLLLPGDTFGSAQAWRLFKQSASEEVWAVLLFLVAMIGATGIDTRHRWIRILSLGLLSAAHGTLALLFLIGNPTGGASGTYAIIALLGYYLLWRQML